MWQSSETNISSKSKDLEKQQDKLRTMWTNSQKPSGLSADVMINGLLNNKETFRKTTTIPSQPDVATSSFKTDNFPKWLHPNSVPTFYQNVWSLVHTSNMDGLVDTQKISRLLLTSGLHTDVLGYIWNLANKTILGQLTQFELYLILALVALAQNGHTFNDLNVLNFIPSAPIPNLHLNIFNYQTSVQTNQEQSVSTYTDGHLQKQELPPKTSFPCIGSSPTPEDDFTDFQCVTPDKKKELIKEIKSSNDDFDEFTDFQKADTSLHKDPFETVIVSQKKASGIKIKSLPKITLNPKVDGKGKDMLSTLPESKISSDNKVLTTMPSISVLGSRGVGTRLAHHTLESRPEKQKTNHKSHKTKLPTIPPPINIEDLVNKSKTLITTSEDLFPKCKHSFILKETKIGAAEIQDTEQTRQIEIPCLGTINETSLPSHTQELMSVCEDKYSALRGLDLGLQSKDLDDFGDFLCADVTETNAQASTSKEIDLLNDLETPLNNFSQVSSVDNLKNETKRNIDDEFSDFTSFEPIKSFEPEKSLETINWLDGVSTPTNLQTKEENLLGANNALNNFQRNEILNIEPINWLSNNSNDLEPLTNIDEIKPNMKKDFSVEENKESNGDPMLWNLESFQTAQLEESFKTTNLKEIFTPNQEDSIKIEESFETNIQPIVSKPIDWTNINLELNDGFGDFLKPQVKDEVNLSRHSSLPSLDLNISPNEDNLSREIILKKTLETCLHLFEQAVDVLYNCPCDVLEEVFETQIARNYLQNLHIVLDISRQIGIRSYKQEFSDTLDDIEKHWSQLEEICKQFEIKIESTLSTEPISSTEQCCICFSSISSDPVRQGDLTYHPTCANLWINCIDTTLPCPM